ncbi:LIM domain only protein 3-like isoform X2 [Daphnia carinata]|uniref:LIM domain only protein 3-like isoform X2 n=1 Tax=Daphnia carinata TaxID=120202 RepID=UPI00257F5CA0|nr:LIM domain only protein 3-like isoform X2 [Daphnia carinata]
MSTCTRNTPAALMASHFFKFNPANAKRIDMRTDTNAEYRKSAGLTTPQECGGCGKFITDRYLLQALDLYWHEDCLKCGCCDCRLSENGSTLYTRANLVLCRRDYLRLFGTTGYCAACGKVIPAFEMVMKAKGNVYHLECFACQNCNHRFCVGDKFYLCDNKILCEYDYEERLLMTSLEFPNKRSSLQPQQSSNQSTLLSPVLSADCFSK